MARKPILFTAAILGLAGAAAIGASVSAYAGGSSPSPAPKAPARPALPAGVHPAAITPHTTATNAHCGQTITASLTLNGDLSCSTAALTVSGTSVVLNLNGHELSGVSIAYGVALTGKSETVENGVITGFYEGVAVTGTTDTVSAVRATYNYQYGILDNGTSTKITNSVAAYSAFYGIYSNGTGSVLSGDHELNNGVSSGYPGLNLAGQKETVTGNIANGNGRYGIYAGGVGATLTKNVADFNHYDGIVTADAAVIDGAGNTAKGNDYAAGTTPEQCSGVVCS